MITRPILIHGNSSKQADTYISGCNDVKWEELVMPVGKDPLQVWA